MSKQTFEKISFFLFLLKGPSGRLGGLNYSFCTLSKMCYKTRNPYSISLKLDTHKMNSRIKFCMNLIMFTMSLMIFLCENILKVLLRLKGMPLTEMA